MNDEEFLQHYGVPGMRWGHRKNIQIAKNVGNAVKKGLKSNIGIAKGSGLKTNIGIAKGSGLKTNIGIAKGSGLKTNLNAAKSIGNAARSGLKSNANAAKAGAKIGSDLSKSVNEAMKKQKGLAINSYLAKSTAKTVGKGLNDARKAYVKADQAFSRSMHEQTMRELRFYKKVATAAYKGGKFGLKTNAKIMKAAENVAKSGLAYLDSVYEKTQKS